ESGLEPSFFADGCFWDGLECLPRFALGVAECDQRIEDFAICIVMGARPDLVGEFNEHLLSTFLAEPDHFCEIGEVAFAYGAFERFSRGSTQYAYGSFRSDA